MKLGEIKSLRVLIVEDDPISNKLLHEILLESPPFVFELASASRIDSAFTLLDKNNFNVVLLDLNLPDSLGLDTLVRLRNSYPRPAIVVVTGAYEDDIGLQAVASGAQEYLVKGRYDKDILIKTIYYAIERKHVEWTLEEINKCFLSFGPNPDENINRIVRTAGLILEGKFALYNKQDDSFLCIAGSWNIPGNFKHKNIKTGRICCDVIAMGKYEPVIINNLDKTFYFQTDPNVSCYRLRTYIGCAVKTEEKAIGSLCVVYDVNKTFALNEVRILSILARAVSIEEKRRRAEIRTRESEQKYRALFDNTKDAVFLADVESSMLLDANKQAEILIGKPRKEIIGMHQFQLYPSDKLDYYSDKFKKYIHAASAIDFEAEVLKKDGSTTSVCVNVSPIQLESKNIIQKIFRDLNDFKKLQEELTQSSKMAILGQLAAGIAHELNQPLTGIKGFAQAALMDLNDASFLRKDLQRIVEQADRMDRIIQNVRFFAMKSEFMLKEIGINQPIEDALMLLSEQLKVHNIRLKLSLDRNLPKIRGDHNQLQQVFLNFITNAKNAIDSLNSPGGGQLTIETALSEDKRNIKIIIEDTGCGISNENLERIFNPFFTTKSHDYGMGLGLSIVHRIIESHKGRIEVESEGGKGTIFVITLPLVHPSSTISAV